MRAPLTIAAAQPACTAKDVERNALEHAGTIRGAQARVVVFPELSLTGYELDADVVSPEHEALKPIADACAETETVALVGAPVEGERGGAQIGTLQVTAAGAKVIYGKSYLGGDESTRFTPGSGPVAIEIDGWRIGLGICKDTGVDQHIADTAALDVDVYLAGLVHLPEELRVQEERGVRIARSCGAYVAFASFAGPTGGGYERTAGVSSIWAPDGTPLARAGSEPGGVARATLDSDAPAVALRRALPEDADRVADIWFRGWRDAHLGSVPQRLVAARTEESFVVRASERIGDTTVATVGGTIAGFVMVSGAEVEQVYVSRLHRGTGVATVLIGQAERQVRAHGHDRAWLAVVAGNPRARAFYARSGWHDEGLFDYAAAAADGPIMVPCHRYTKRV